MFGGWNRLTTQFHSWWNHQMETFSVLLALCAENWPVTGEFPTQRPATRSFDAFFDLRLNKRLSKQSWGWWFEMPSCSLWRHCNVLQSLMTEILGSMLINRGQVKHLCVSNLAIIGSVYCLYPGCHQANIWTNAGILLIGPLGTNFSEILFKIQAFSFYKMHLKMVVWKITAILSWPECVNWILW